MDNENETLETPKPRRARALSQSALREAKARREAEALKARIQSETHHMTIDLETMYAEQSSAGWPGPPHAFGQVDPGTGTQDPLVEAKAAQAQLEELSAKADDLAAKQGSDWVGEIPPTVPRWTPLLFLVTAIVVTCFAFVSSYAESLGREAEMAVIQAEAAEKELRQRLAEMEAREAAP